MKPFNELIKNFDKIRDYLRAFSVYGYKQRDDFAHKSSRTYDNEKRRIQSYLDPYIHEQTSQKGKRISINFDYLSITANPLFEGFKTKSFTKNDMMLHFILLDILISFESLTLTEIYDHLTFDYLNAFENYKSIDQRTIRLKLQEYINAGLILENKEGKTAYYRLAPNPLAHLSSDTINRLYTALSFYQNVAPLGLLGHFILEKEHAHQPYFAFSNLHFSNTVDDLLVSELFRAINEQKLVRFIHQNNVDTIALPLKLVDNVEQGRRYITAYNYSDNQYKFFRLDRLIEIKVLDEVDDFLPQKLKIIDTLLDTTWGIALSMMDSPHQSEVWELILHIDEQTENDLLLYLKNAHSKTSLHRVGPNTFHYTLSILDGNEAVPWLRQFISRIISIDCNNQGALHRFIQDIKLMNSYYEEETDDTL